GRRAQRLDARVQVLRRAGDVDGLDVPVAHLPEGVQCVEGRRDPVGGDAQGHRGAARLVVGRGALVARLDAAARVLDEPRDVLRGVERVLHREGRTAGGEDRKSTRLNSSHVKISYAVFCLKKKTTYP